VAVMWIPDELRTVAGEVGARGSAGPYSVRQLLGWFNSQRRGRVIVPIIHDVLTELKLRTDPNFEYAYIDGDLQFVPAEPSPSDAEPKTAAEQPLQTVVGAAVEDPTYRIGKLPSANSPPTWVNPNATVEEVVTVMLMNDYSQVPVMQGERNLKGAVTWQSIGKKLALGRACRTVQDCIEEAVVISSDTSLFAAIPTIVERGFVLVRDAQSLISGMVTTTDLSLQFRQLAEPFLLLGEIENHLRRLSNGKFSPLEVASVRDPSDTSRAISDLSDLTFGEHVRLLENPDRWAALKLKLDRSTFVKHLNEVRDIRNDVMHFDPDGTAPSELENLRKFVRLLGALGN
jgi:CBS domain-containing protein